MAYKMRYLKLCIDLLFQMARNTDHSLLTLLVHKQVQQSSVGEEVHIDWKSSDNLKYDFHLHFRISKCLFYRL
jgi:hypothetical protein